MRSLGIVAFGQLVNLQRMSQVLTNPTELAAATTTTVQSFFDYVEEWRGALVDMQASLDFTNAEDDAAAQKPTLAAATIVASGGAQRSVGEADDV